MLSVTATNSTAVTVSGSDGTTYTLTATGGSQAVSPSATTTYTASATGTGGSASAKTTVTVVPVPPPAPIVTIAASPTSVNAGSSSTLTVTATNATAVTVTGSDGSIFTLTASGGTQAVSPAATTVYTATATGAANATATAQATVTVVPLPPPAAPTVTIAANPATVNVGNSTNLVVTATNATQVTISGSDGSSYSLPASGGTQAVKPSTTTVYTASATGLGGTVTAMATVTVALGPPISVTIAANPTTIVAGNTTTLTVTAVNATSVAITGTDGSSYLVSASGGTKVVTPLTTTTYTATATGLAGNQTATATVTVTPAPPPTVTLTANPTSVNAGSPSTLTVNAAQAIQVTVTGTDGSSYNFAVTNGAVNNGTQAVTPATTTTYTATATGPSSNATATATLTVIPGITSINHVVFMLQENHSFDNYFGMLNPYREDPLGTGTCPNNADGVPQCWNIGDDGNTYTVDGIDDKLNTISNEADNGTVIPLYKFTTTCIDDDSSAWLSSYGDANRWDFTTSRKIKMDGFVHTAEGFAANCLVQNNCSGNFTDDTDGMRAMGYYDQGFLNYYYFMASEFALSDRWFSPIATKSTDNRVATYTGGTTQGLVYDPGYNDHLGGVSAKSIFQELDQNNVSWKVYYTITDGQCGSPDDCTPGAASYPATNLGYVYYPDKYIYKNPTGAPCVAPTQPSSVVGDPSNYFCIDPTHVAPLTQYYSDVANGALASFTFIEAGYGLNDEHPGSFQPITLGQQEMSQILGAFMNSPSWNDSVFFFSYDEGGGPYDHVPPIPGHSNDYTDSSMLPIPDIGSISVNADSYWPCESLTYPIASQHCDLHPNDPGISPDDASSVDGFAAQIGFRVPNMVISPFARRHYVSHIPMDHTAVIKFVENRFIGPSAHLTARDAAQPDLLDFFDFVNVPWATPPTPPTPVGDKLPNGYSACQPANMGP
jgi:phospholipase C